MEFRIVVAIFQPVHPGFIIVDIATITERISVAQRTRHAAGTAQKRPPCIILVFYHEVTATVNNTHHVATEINFQDKSKAMW